MRLIANELVNIHNDVKKENLKIVDVSIIIPVYNAEKYLSQCLDSILFQTLKNIEIICVDDGSADNSYKILEEYAQKDSRIKVIHQENKGSSAARNAGLKVASGKYIGYVDSDDWIEPQMFEQLYQVAESNQVDMVSSGYLMEGAYTSEHYDSVSSGLFCGDKMENLRANTIYCMEQKDVGLRGALWCKLFLRDLLMKVQLQVPETLSFSEDKMCVITYVLEAKSVFVLKETYYHYRIHSLSMVHKPNSEYLYRVNEVYKYLTTLYSHKNFTNEIRKQAELYVTELLIKGINSRLGFQNRNMLWIDPYWLDKIPTDSRVILYGGGELGQKYKTHLLNKKELHYVANVDFGYEKFKESSLLVQSPELLKEDIYDYVVITIKNPGKAKQIIEQLEEFGIDKDKILWFEQPEIFWKYAQADGLLEETGE